MVEREEEDLQLKKELIKKLEDSNKIEQDKYELFKNLFEH